MTRKIPPVSYIQAQKALRALQEVAREQPRIPWALIGGLALQAHGVPRTLLDIDILVRFSDLERLAKRLAAAGWQPFYWDQRTKSYKPQKRVEVQEFDNDPVLRELGEARQIVQIGSPQGFPFDILAAQHPFEQAGFDEREVSRAFGVNAPLVPLGSLLLAKALADRQKDRGTIEQVAETLPGNELEAAVRWAKKYDPKAAKRLAAAIAVVHRRLTPNRRRRIQ